MEKTPHEYDRPDDEEHKRHERWYWLVTGCAAVIAAGATGLAAWYAHGAYVAALQSVDASRDQAEIARRQLEVAQDVEFRQLRAYVGVEVTNFAATDNGVNVVLRLKNYGVSPATSVRLKVDIAANLRDFDPSSLINKRPFGSAFSLFPSSEFTVGLTIPIPPAWDVYARAEANKSGGSADPVIFGIIAYSTIFESASLQRTTMFCMYARQGGGVRTLPAACEHYNQID